MLESCQSSIKGLWTRTIMNKVGCWLDIIQGQVNEEEDKIGQGKVIPNRIMQADYGRTKQSKLIIRLVIIHELENIK